MCNFLKSYNCISVNVAVEYNNYFILFLFLFGYFVLVKCAIFFIYLFLFLSLSLVSSLVPSDFHSGRNSSR